MISKAQRIALAASPFRRDQRYFARECHDVNSKSSDDDSMFTGPRCSRVSTLREIRQRAARFPSYFQRGELIFARASRHTPFFLFLSISLCTRHSCDAFYVHRRPRRFLFTQTSGNYAHRKRFRIFQKASSFE